jgi:hypothetical protein
LEQARNRALADISAKRAAGLCVGLPMSSVVDTVDGPKLLFDPSKSGHMYDNVISLAPKFNSFPF